MHVDLVAVQLDMHTQGNASSIIPSTVASRVGWMEQTPCDGARQAAGRGSGSPCVGPAEALQRREARAQGPVGDLPLVKECGRVCSSQLPPDRDCSTQALPVMRAIALL